jgi:hypothetical protein
MANRLSGFLAHTYLTQFTLTASNPVRTTMRAFGSNIAYNFSDAVNSSR